MILFYLIGINEYIWIGLLGQKPLLKPELH